MLPLLRRYTWQAEAAFVALCLLIVVAASGGRFVEWVGAFAVFFGFMHAQVATSLEEQQKELPKPSVECWRWLQRYHYTKETLWFLYFVMLHAWSALVGVVLFLLFPVWRRYWRQHLSVEVPA